MGSITGRFGAGRVTTYNMGGGATVTDRFGQVYDVPGGPVNTQSFFNNLQNQNNAMTGAISAAQDQDAKNLFADNVANAVQNPAQMTKEQYDGYASRIGEIQRSFFSDDQKRSAISQILTEAGIFHDVNSLDMGAPGLPDAGGLLSKRLKIIEPSEEPGGGGSSAQASVDADNAAADTAAEVVNSSTSDNAAEAVLAAAGINDLSNVASEANKLVNPFPGAVSNNYVFDGQKFVGNFRTDSSDGMYSELVPDATHRQLLDMWSQETDPDLKIALQKEVENWANLNGNAWDDTNPMQINRYDVFTDTIPSSDIAMGNDVAWNKGDTLYNPRRGSGGKVISAEHIGTNADFTGQKNTDVDEKFNVNIQNYIDGNMTWNDLQLYAQRYYGFGTIAANQAIGRASQAILDARSDVSSPVDNSGNAKAAATSGIVAPSGLKAPAAAEAVVTGGQDAVTPGAGAAAGGLPTGGIAPPVAAVNPQGEQKCGPGTKLAGQLKPEDGNCNPVAKTTSVNPVSPLNPVAPVPPSDPGDDDLAGSGIGGGEGIGDGIGAGLGEGDGEGDGEAEEESDKDFLMSLSQNTPITEAGEINIDRLTRYRTPLLQRLFV